jgi:peptide/nickel transport system permease protein
MWFLLRRIAHVLWLFVAVSLLSFLMLSLSPGDFVADMQVNPQISPATVERVRKEYDLDQPLAIRYVRWLAAMARGHFGYSFAYNMPAESLLWARAENTLLLTIPGTTIAWILAVPLGIRAAAARGGPVDRLCTGATSVLLAVPDLVLPLALLVIAARTGWVPTGGMLSPLAMDATWSEQIRDLIRHALLPVSVLAAMIFPIVFRHVRTTVISFLDAPAIRAARMRGIPQRRLLLRHVLRLAANPLVSLLGISVSTLLSTALIIEVVMSWPGLGPLLIEAILARDVHVVVGAVLFSTVFLVLGGLLADVLLLLVDPRIRMG